MKNKNQTKTNNTKTKPVLLSLEDSPFILLLSSFFYSFSVDLSSFKCVEVKVCNLYLRKTCFVKIFRTPCNLSYCPLHFPSSFPLYQTVLGKISTNLIQLIMSTFDIFPLVHDPILFSGTVFWYMPCTSSVQLLANPKWFCRRSTCWWLTQGVLPRLLCFTSFNRYGNCYWWEHRHTQLKEIGLLFWKVDVMHFNKQNSTEEGVCGRRVGRLHHLVH